MAADIDAARAREELNTAEREGGPEAEDARNRALSRLRAVGEHV
jgi:hypothetical protein